MMIFLEVVVDHGPSGCGGDARDMKMKSTRFTAQNRDY